MSLTVADLFDRDVRERVAGRVFDIRKGQTFICADGYCVVGALLDEVGIDAPEVPSETSAALCALDALDVVADDPRSAARAIFMDLIRANDRGELATTAGVRRALMLEDRP